MNGAYTMNEPILIVGAGLSGIRAATLLQAQGIEYRIIEARNRIGGRILSEEVEGQQDLGKFDLGPTWFWPQREPVISNLVNELGLRTFEQHTAGEILFEPYENGAIQRHLLPAGAVEKSLRLVGGIGSLIQALAESIPADRVELNSYGTHIQLDEDDKMTVDVRRADGSREKIRAKAVVLALPPRIIASHITFSPQLPQHLLTSLQEQPTWMAGQAKAIAIYERPFWREDGLSGQSMSRTGPLSEIHDASPETGIGALFGFFSMPPKMRQELGEEQVMERVVDQLTRFYGPAAKMPLALLYKDWSSDTKTAVENDSKPLTDFPEYGPPPQSTEWGQKILFASTEATANHGGHLEGALQSAERAVAEVLKMGNQTL